MITNLSGNGGRRIKLKMPVQGVAATLFTAILISVSLLGYVSSRTTELDTDLKLVHVIFRHGERTTEGFYPNDPYKNKTFFPIGLGGLTNTGKMGEYKLGEFLRLHYNDFLGNIYTNDIMAVRSTDVTRTKMSAQLVSAGLWPPKDPQVWKKDLMWQPIPVFFKPSHEEDLLNIPNCPRKNSLLDELPKRPEVQEKFIKPYQDIYQYIGNYTGKSMDHPRDILNLMFILQSEVEANLTLPKWAYSVFPEPIYTLAAKAYEYLNYDEELVKINIGYLYKKIIKDSVEKSQNALVPEERKIFLYSGHETTVGWFLEVLKTEASHVPPYGSSIMVEVHKNKKSDDHYIKIKYRPGRGEPHVLDIKGCTQLCPLDKFIELHKHMLPNLSVKEACQRADDDYEDR